LESYRFAYGFNAKLGDTNFWWKVSNKYMNIYRVRILWAILSFTPGPQG
jgi:hypothetical protein